MASSSLLTNKTFDKLSVNNLSVNKLFNYDKDTINNNLLGENNNPRTLYLFSNNRSYWNALPNPINPDDPILILWTAPEDPSTYNKGGRPPPVEPTPRYKYYYEYSFKNELTIGSWKINTSDNFFISISTSNPSTIKSRIKISNINYFDLDTGEFIIIKT